MKLKVEFINGSIEVIRIEQVAVNLPCHQLSFIYDYYEDYAVYPLKKVSRVTVDNEVIYDNMGRKENHKKEIV